MSKKRGHPIKNKRGIYKKILTNIRNIINIISQIKLHRSSFLTKEFAIFAGLLLSFVLLFTLLILGVFKARPADKKTSASSGPSVVGYLDPLELIENFDKYVLIDVRREAEYERGRLKGAVNIPFRREKDFVEEVRDVKGKKTVVLYDRSVYNLTAEKAAEYLSQHGVEVKVLSVGWREFLGMSSMWLPEDKIGKIDLRKYLDFPKEER